MKEWAQKDGRWGNSSYKGRGACIPPAALLTAMTTVPWCTIIQDEAAHIKPSLTHTHRERIPELRTHRYTVSPWFVKTRTYSESTQPRRASRYKRWRREGRPGRERAPEPRPISASVYINLSLLLCETEQKRLWREDKSCCGSSEPLWSRSNW